MQTRYLLQRSIGCSQSERLNFGVDKGRGKVGSTREVRASRRCGGGYEHSIHQRHRDELDQANEMTRIAFVDRRWFHCQDRPTKVLRKWMRGKPAFWEAWTDTRYSCLQISQTPPILNRRSCPICHCCFPTKRPRYSLGIPNLTKAGGWKAFLGSLVSIVR